MKTLPHAVLLALLATSPSLAQDLPGTLSPEAAQALLDTAPVDQIQGDLSAINAALEEAAIADGKAALARLPATLEEVEIAGRTQLWITPENLDPARADRVILHIHGGAHAFFSPHSTLTASLPAAHAAKTKILAVDYPLAWEAPFPAARDHVLDVYGEILKDYRPDQVIFSGDSAGGGLILSVLQAMDAAGLPMPAGAALLSPWVDISDTGDSNITLRDLDPIIVYDKNLSLAAQTYAGDLPLTDPGPSPIYGDFSPDLPPIFITTGTRDLFLSGAARLQRALRAAQVPVDLMVYEGMWHVFQVQELPESEAAWEDYSRFIDGIWP
ncbi:MAG: alpha/beta hydrolase [Mangrovicoccus sp.]|nr:alpha/beta hydrolase [Mangrovicoccus sp.]